MSKTTFINSTTRNTADIPRQTPMRKIAEATADYHGLKARNLFNASRARRYSWPRQDAMLRMHNAGWGLSDIGRFFNFDHTTVIHGIKSARARITQ